MEFNSRLNGIKDLFKYSNTIKTIYPADDLALSRLPAVFGKYLETDVKCLCRITGNQVQFENQFIFPVWFKPYHARFFTAIDSGTILISKGIGDKIEFSYELRFFKRTMVFMVIALLFSRGYNFNFLYVIAIVALIQSVSLAISIQLLKVVISDSLKNRYR